MLASETVPNVARRLMNRSRCAAACETCKRRKERCDGAIPCARCVERGVRSQCRFTSPTTRQTARTLPSENSAADARHGSFTSGTDAGLSGNDGRRLGTGNDQSESNAAASTTSITTFKHARLIQDRKGRYMFIGESANLYFLQTIRLIVGDSVGPCELVDDPLQCFMVEASPEDRFSTDATCRNHSPEISLSEAQKLIKRYAFATSCVLDLFDESELLEHVEEWLDGQSGDCTIPTSIYYLVLAIGAQNSSEDRDELADTLFTHGRWLTNQHMEDAGIPTAQSYALITMYLLGASRRNCAFLNLGIAVRAGYAIGLHLKQVSATFSRREFETRERLWKVIRILDLFMSTSLGRPSSTAETRDTEADNDYSASNDLCAIFEKILSNVYSRRVISTEAFDDIGAHHRRWASRFFRGLATDKIQPLDVLHGAEPNIGLIHVKEAWYWCVILLTRPYLTESVSLHTKRRASNSHLRREPCTANDSNQVLVHACLDSAIRTIALLKVFVNYDDLPKRLPFVVNSVFVAALVLSLGFFGDLHQLFPLERSLHTAQLLLAKFPHDLIAQRNANIVSHLRDACNVYLEKRTAEEMDLQGRAVGSMFGQIHRLRSRGPTRPHSPTGKMKTAHEPNRTNTTPERIGPPQEADVRTTYTDLASFVEDEAYPYLFDERLLDDDILNPIMAPETLWFGSYEENATLISTMDTSNGFS